MNFKSEGGNVNRIDNITYAVLGDQLKYWQLLLAPHAIFNQA